MKRAKKIKKTKKKIAEANAPQPTRKRAAVKGTSPTSHLAANLSGKERAALWLVRQMCDPTGAMYNMPDEDESLSERQLAEMGDQLKKYIARMLRPVAKYLDGRGHTYEIPNEIAGHM